MEFIVGNAQNSSFRGTCSPARHSFHKRALIYQRTLCRQPTRRDQRLVFAGDTRRRQFSTHRFPIHRTEMSSRFVAETQRRRGAGHRRQPCSGSQPLQSQRRAAVLSFRGGGDDADETSRVRKLNGNPRPRRYNHSDTEYEYTLHPMQQQSIEHRLHRVSEQVRTHSGFRVQKGDYRSSSMRSHSKTRTLSTADTLPRLPVSPSTRQFNL